MTEPVLTLTDLTPEWLTDLLRWRG
ncbi:MAG: hypothetical protein RIQ28_605, partial [Pseudomonadota bacterium]